MFSKAVKETCGAMASEDLALQDDNDSDREMEQSIWIDDQLQQDSKREALNKAMDDITTGRVSPIQCTLDSPWDKITQRQRTCYTRKATEVLDTMLSTLAPVYETELLESLYRAMQHGETIQTSLDSKTVDYLVGAYNQASN